MRQGGNETIPFLTEPSGGVNYPGHIFTRQYLSFLVNSRLIKIDPILNPFFKNTLLID